MYHGRLSWQFWQTSDRDHSNSSAAVRHSSRDDSGAGISEWNVAISVLVQKLHDKSREKLLADVLHKYRMLVRKYLGTESIQEQIDDCAVKSLLVFIESRGRVTGKKERDALRKVFHTSFDQDPFIEAAVPLIKQLVPLIPEEEWVCLKETVERERGASCTNINTLIDQFQNVITADLDATEQIPRPSVDNYGISALAMDTPPPPPVAVQVDETREEKRPVELQNERPMKVVGKFAEKLEDGSGSDLVKLLITTQYEKSEGGNVSVTDLVSMVEPLLTGGKRDDELQEELVEMLGFQNLDLVTSLLTNRNAVRRNKEKAARNKGSGRPERPLYHSQVEVRKKTKNESDVNGILTTEEEDARLAEKWQMQEMQRAQKTDLDSYVTRTYPFVFDQLAELKKSAALFQGQKIVLPDHVVNERKSCQEIIVEAPSKNSIPVDRLPPLVRIKDMDEVIRTLFEGYDFLNQIQSAVYRTAYTTSENMLVCAPTGAGKTNTAMLAIAREISQHMTSPGVVDKSFKVIYVAPMKALASEMVRTFSERLKYYKLRVEEVTGDTQVAMHDLEKTQMIITTPEKWDVITRKSVGDTKLVGQVSLLIIDEIHLLNDERGPVIESLVARTIRMIEEQQKMIRIVGLSATLPTYEDVADFLHVNKEVGMFFFDGRFRPVPLRQTFIGMKTVPGGRNDVAMAEVMYEKLMENIKGGHQVLVFVHARNQTHRVANTIREMAVEHGDSAYFIPNSNDEDYDNKHLVSRMVIKKMQDFSQKTANRELKTLVMEGIAIHHAGMVRSDRSGVERLFKDGGIRVLVCTATLAWGVNLPAHAVIIFGTKLYRPEKGTYEDIDVLDVQQIFGRAGRPQFDTSGHGIIITEHKSLPKFISMLTSSQDIESQLPDHLVEHLNAEIVLHNVTKVSEAVDWLRSTYWYRRLHKKPLIYGIDKTLAETVPNYMETWFTKKVTEAAKTLDQARMIRFNERNGFLMPTQFGNIASWYYIDVKTMLTFADDVQGLHDKMQEYQILSLVCKATEFSQIKVRDEEMTELDEWEEEYVHLPFGQAMEDSEKKVNVLIQSYISHCQPKTHSLSSDLYYCQQNAARIMRAVFQMAMYKNYTNLADSALNLCLFVENRMWISDHPLKQLQVDLPLSVYQHLAAKHLTIERLKDLDEVAVGQLVHNRAAGQKVKHFADMYPLLDVETVTKPIGNGIIQIILRITPNFVWNDKVLGTKRVLNFWIWAEDPANNCTYHTQEYALQKTKVLKHEIDQLDFVIPSHDKSRQILIHIRSDRFLHCKHQSHISLGALKVPKTGALNTAILHLRPLSLSALHDPVLESLYSHKHFNAIQTQAFHTLMHTDLNILLGAPTGSGKTIAAELAIFRALKITKCKVVYIAPLKALVKERVADWKARLETVAGWKVVELTGDTTPDIRAINAAHIIISTPEKWDGISRSWQHRSYVQDVKLLIFDEIHMLGEDRGPIIEVIVSRTNFIASFTHQKVRIIGLSTALASADDVASWLNIYPAGLFNFNSAVRPVPLVYHISGYPGKHYCPRMQLMNKPTYQAIRTHSNGKPVLVFVSSRRQTRLTGFALLSFAALDQVKWNGTTDEELSHLTSDVRDPDLKQLLMYGIGIHHAGLHEKDRVTVEQLFLKEKILVMIATATLAWGVNFPAHLVVIKGTEYYDGKTKQYVKMPVTDVLQMAGRAGRPQFDTEGVAVILCHEPLKHYYSKFLHHPLPVESQLQDVLPDHINAEIVAGTLITFEGTLEYMTWTYLFRRLLANPDYYSVIRPISLQNPEKAANMLDDDPVLVADVKNHVKKLILDCLIDLKNSGCVEYDENEGRRKFDGDIPNFLVFPTYLGTIASYYYLKHGTMRILHERLTPSAKLSEVLLILSDVQEFAQVPVRHNEDAENGLLSRQVPLPVETSRLDSSHAKVFLLLQVYFSRNQIAMPNADYATDLKSHVLDQVMRIIQTAPSASIAVRGYDRNVAGTLPALIHYTALSKKNESHLGTLLRNICPPGKGHDDKIIETILSFPLLEVELGLKKNVEADSGDNTDSSIRTVNIVDDRNLWIDVECGGTYVLEINCIRLLSRKTPGRKVATSRFHKPKDEGWWLLLGEVDSGELLAMKRVGFISRSLSSSLLFSAPSQPGRVILHFYLVSDSYFGLDQQMAVQLQAVEPHVGL
ncbi:activating signal cointegrator 1 complex subunit 3-like [Paramacrobiotus metropolitanus]|uniref:activating signal cointegrator 1 complex subunit 3-like n=1 Tax=Paramacrobiotus metropolitanus TaxID=2943436 RepID=UPI00244652A6|nr:activating signal cointegrator 1 complex subunit 3-like [Paramacrobiotus metropolitanus]